MSYKGTLPTVECGATPARLNRFRTVGLDNANMSAICEMFK